MRTIVFNTFVWMQIFNEFNNRRLDNKFNVFEGLLRNNFFIFINFLMVGLQVTIIYVGGKAFSIVSGGISGEQWALSVVLAVLCMPSAVAVRLFPDHWFAMIAKLVGTPVVFVYQYFARGLRRVGRVFRKIKKNTDEEAIIEEQDVKIPTSSNGSANKPVLVVSDSNQSQYDTDLEGQGRRG